MGRIADPASLPQLQKLAENYLEFTTQRTLWEACAAARTSTGSNNGARGQRSGAAAERHPGLV